MRHTYKAILGQRVTVSKVPTFGIGKKEMGVIAFNTYNIFVLYRVRTLSISIDSTNKHLKSLYIFIRVRRLNVLSPSGQAGRNHMLCDAVYSTSTIQNCHISSQYNIELN